MHDELGTNEAEKRFHSDSLMLELGNALVANELLSHEALQETLSHAALTGKSISQILVAENRVSETAVLTELAKLSNHPHIPISGHTIQPAAVERIQARIAIRYQIMPIESDQDSVTIAISRVPTLSETDSLRMLVDARINWVLMTEDEISKSIKHFYGLGAEAVDAIVEEKKTNRVEIETQDVSLEDADAGVVKFVNQVIAEAISLNATDIHIEPFDDALRLRYRIDGVLQEIPVPQGISAISRSISSSVKIMADMDIAERRKPHDGRINVRSGGDEFDLRVSILPTGYGETVNMRILNRKTMFLSLEKLGLTSDQLPPVEYLSSLPHGVILLTGPTGSGKTTTLYAILSRINKNDSKIITVEDPVEYQMHGISQVQTHAKIGLTFASILRSILRHDPDIILIGEIRDMETADIAVRASLTGHLVFSTLHTNDAPSAIARLIDMGVESYLVSSCLEGVIAQRLVRRNCISCAEEHTPDQAILEEISAIHPDQIGDATFRKGNGCPDCGFTGYSGRIALYEIMLMDDGLRSMVVEQRPSNEIKHHAMSKGMVTLRRDGWLRAMSGMTTVQEVLRVARKQDNG